MGDCLVDVPLREIRAPGKRRPLRITPKSMAVLLVLIEQAGRVVSRDALMAEVWPDTLPTNDVVTQAITQLRKAFDDERGNPRYIETIAKNGYRLLAPVEWLYVAGVASAEADAQRRRALGRPVAHHFQVPGDRPRRSERAAGARAVPGDGAAARQLAFDRRCRGDRGGAGVGAAGAGRWCAAAMPARGRRSRRRPSICRRCAANGRTG